MGLNNTRLNRETFAFLVVAIDILGILILFLSFFFIKRSQNKTEQIFLEEIIFISDFTLHFSNIRFNADKIYEDFEDFYNHLNNVYKVEIQKKIDKINQKDKSLQENEIKLELERLEQLKENNNNIFYDINFTFVDMDRIETIFKKNKLVIKRKKLEFEFEKLEKDFDENITKNRKYRLDLDIRNVKKEEERLLEEYLKFKKNFQIIDDVYVTFKNTEEVEIIKNAYKKGKISRCCTIFCCNRISIKHL